MPNAYYVYRGVGGIENVDFDTPVDTLGSGETEPTLTDLGHAALTTYCYVIRPVLGALETPDLSCRVLMETDAAGDWVGNRPVGVEAFSATVIAGGEIRLRWTYRTPYGGSAPNDFGIYYSTTGPDITLGSPDATKSYTTDGQYVEDLALSDGVSYWVCVTARTATPVESMRSAILGPLLADDTAPANPAVYAASAW